MAQTLNTGLTGEKEGVGRAAFLPGEEESIFLPFPASGSVCIVWLMASLYLQSRQHRISLVLLHLPPLPLTPTSLGEVPCFEGLMRLCRAQDYLPFSGSLAFIAFVKSPLPCEVTYSWFGLGLGFGCFGRLFCLPQTCSDKEALS